MKKYPKNQPKEPVFLTKTQKIALWVYNNAHIVEYWLVGVRDVFCLFICMLSLYALSLLEATL